MYEENGFVIVQRYSSWQKKKIRTIVVNARSKVASQKSIAAAIAIANPYDRIEVSGGEYNEALTVQIPLEIVAGEGEDPTILSRSSAITITTPGIDVYMERIRLATKSTSKLDAALVAIAGNPILYRCQCTSVLLGGQASAHLDECMIKDSNTGFGILVQDSAGGTIKSTTIKHHTRCCVEIDTRGELQATDCTIENDTGGDAISLSGAASSSARDEGNPGYPCCSHVDISHCRFSVSTPVTEGMETAGQPTNIVGHACCVVLTQGAAPTLSQNEFFEGEIGVLIEGPGTAQLAGNIVRCQRRSGVLALVEEGSGFTQGHQSLRITGDNVFDRCHIGIDVQCYANRASYTGQSGPGSSGAERVLCNELPAPKRAFSWIPLLQCGGVGGPSPSRLPKASPHNHSSALVEGEWKDVEELKKQLQKLVTTALLAYPTCLQQSFGVMAGGAVALAVDGRSPGLNGANPTLMTTPFAELLNQMLGTSLGAPGVGPSASAAAKEVAAAAEAEMLLLRGNKGIDIINTKFSNCELCAIRFGKQGYGLVDQCVFEDCGTYAIVVDCAAHPLITGCRFLRSRGASILVANFANPLILGNEVGGGKNNGIEFVGMSRGLVLGNMISTHVGVGVIVDGLSSPLLCANAVSQNRRGGVCIAGDSRPALVLNTLYGNATAQVACQSGADAYVGHNRILAGTDVGLQISDCARGHVVGNLIKNNGDGILVELDADPYITENEITENMGCGTKMTNNAMGSVVSNKISKNSGANVLVMEGAATHFRGNTIEKSAQGGVVVAGEGRGYFEKNIIQENSAANVLITDSFTDPIFVSNRITSSTTGCGIVCTNDSKGKFFDNKVFENKQCGIFVSEGATPVFEKNDVSREAVGVLVSDRGAGTFTENKIQGCYGCGVLCQRFGAPTFRCNVVSQSKLSGVQIAPDGLGTFEENQITGNDVGLHLGSSLSSAKVVVDSVYMQSGSGALSDSATPYGNSSTAQSGSCGGRRVSSIVGGPLKRQSIGAVNAQSEKSSMLQNIVSASERRRSSGTLGRGAQCFISKNSVTNNVNGGVLLDAQANAVVENNVITGNREYGIRGDCTYAGKRAESLLQQNYGISSPVVPQRFPSGGGSASSITLALLRSNTVHSHTRANIFLQHFNGEDHTTEVVGNTITKAPMGLYVGTASSLFSFSKNEVSQCMDGLYFEKSGTAHCLENVIHDCEFTGVTVRDLGAPDVDQNNTIERCGLCGVLVDAGGQGIFRRCVIRHCTTGVIVFAGAAVPYHVSYEEVLKANIASSSPLFEHNVIEENETHGVLVLSVISGCSLRTPIQPSSTADAGGATKLLLHDEPVPYDAAPGNAVMATRDRLSPTFIKNTIQKNRLLGVYHDRFEHWDLTSIDNGHGERKASLQQGAVKNAYGGYELMLGTSQVMDSEDHQKKRKQKQVTFIENTITECAIGFCAGYGCHPFLLRNTIIKNDFIGVFLRFGSAITAFGDAVSQNGLAGIYAAKGAKGFITKCTIEENNGWSRPPTTPHAERDFSSCSFAQSFWSRPSPPLEGRGGDEEDALTAFHHSNERSCEQLSLLSAVHTYTITDAVRHMVELVAASSCGMCLATGCAPTGLFEGSSAMSSPTSTRRKLGGVALDDYARLCTADGGIGVWAQQESRVTLSRSTIRGHRHAGVLVTSGLLRHHSTLHGAFAMEFKAMKERKEKTDGAGGVNIFSSDYCVAPVLASSAAGALFTPLPLCVTGIAAALQRVNSTLMMSNDNSYASFPTSALPSARKPAVEDKEERTDSIYHISILGNSISQNGDGVYLELFHSGTTNVAGGGGIAPEAHAEGPTTVSSGEVTQIDQEVMSAKYSNLDFCVVLEQNKIFHNAGFGIYCTHVAYLHAEGVVLHRGMLNDAIDRDYERVRSELLLKRQPDEVALGKLPFTVQYAKRGAQHAVARGNEVSGNTRAQLAAESRFVAIAKDGSRTLLQLDTSAVLQTSNYASQVLLGIPLTAALLQRPAPGVFLCVANTFRDGRQGVLVSGYMGSHNVHLEGNVFTGLRTVAVSVEGHLASATVGKGNHFEQNAVGVKVNVDGSGYSPSCYVTKGYCVANVPFRPRTRIFQNLFKGSTETAVRFEQVGRVPPLLYRNDFSGHEEGSASVLYYTEPSATTVTVQGNVFRDSYCPVVIAGRNMSAVHAALSATSSLHFVENEFTNNYIGALICNGGFPLFTRNLFHNNVRAGVEIVGHGTKPTLRNCLFRQHTSGSNSDRSSRSAVTRLKYSHAVITVQQKFPEGGTFSLPSDALSVVLCEENHGIATAAFSTTGPLSVGVLMNPHADAIIEACSFDENDVGVDAVNEVRHAGTASTAAQLTPLPNQSAFSGCLFRKNKSAGVLTRSVAKTGEASSGSPKRKTEVSSSPLSGPSAEVVSFAGCLFLSNGDPSGAVGAGGDVVALERGAAHFTQNTFGGTVVGEHKGCAVFSKNLFVNASKIADSLAASSPTSEAKGTGPIGVLLREETEIQVHANTFVSRRVGIKALPCSRGEVRENVFAQCTTGLLLGPFTKASVSQNRLLACQDCGVMAYGGSLTDNEIVGAPTGVVVQHSSQYKEINAVPSHKRDTLEVMCMRNSISVCAGDGILVATAGLFEENTVSRCKVGVNLVSPPTANGLAGKPPVVAKCAVYDNATGIVLDNASESTVKENDIFDNEMLGVLVMMDAAGLLQGNRISSTLELGAMELPTGARVKALGNVIRNQFSPAYQRGTRQGRQQEYQKLQAQLDGEVEDLEKRAKANVDSMEIVVDAMTRLAKELKQFLSAPITETVDSLAGAPSRALRAMQGLGHHEDSDAALEEEEEVEEGSSDPGVNRTKRGSISNPARILAPSRFSSAGSTNDSTRRRSAIGSAGSRRSSLAATAARKNAKPPLDQHSGGTPKAVYVHVLSSPEQRAAASSSGDAIAAILAKPPLSRLHFSTTVTTSSSQLLSHLESTSAKPYIGVVVVDASFKESMLVASDNEALEMLHEKMVGSWTSPTRCILYVVAPEAFDLTSCTPTGDGGLAELASFGGGVLTYSTSISSVLEELHQRLSEDVKRKPGSRKVSVSAPLPHYGSGSEGDSASSPKQLLPSIMSSSGTAPPRRKSVTVTSHLTTEYVGNLLSQLTPAALGLERPPSGAKKGTKKRKSSASVNAQGSDGATGTVRRRSVGARRGSSATGRSRTSSVASTTGTGKASASRRTSVASKKSVGKA